MATLNNQYSGLITKGLGLPACAGLITMGFSLFHIQINVQPSPPPNIGGGGWAAHAVPANPYYTPLNQSNYLKPRVIDISIKFKGTKTWRQSYSVTDNQAKHVVKVINIVNKIKSNIKVKISNLKESVNNWFNTDKE